MEKGQQQVSGDIMRQAAGVIGVVAIAFAGLAAVKDRLGLSWAVTVLLTAGALVALGYATWHVRAALRRLMTGTAQSSVVLKQEVPVQDTEAMIAHPELTAALKRASAIGQDQVIRQHEAAVTEVQTGILYDFLVPEGGTYQDVKKRISAVAGMFGVTRLQMTTERSWENERHIKLLKLREPPFSRPFVTPARKEIEASSGVPFGPDVTDQLAGVPTFGKTSMLVFGMTQTSKTTLANGLITCLLIAYSEFDLYLLDGKFRGLTQFEKIATRYESSDDPAIFEDIVDELSGRSDVRCKKISKAVHSRQPVPSFKPVIFIADEAADYFTHNGTKQQKERARRIAEKTRALASKSIQSGIVMVLMTRGPSTNAIPATVRGQFQYRLCLYEASSGAVKLSLGDMYFDTASPIIRHF